MAELALFQPQEALDAQTRLAEFIRHARNDITVFGPDLDWDAPAWELRGVARVSGRSGGVLRVNWGHPLKRSPQSNADYAPLDARTVDFFKAYLRYRYGFSPLMNPHQMLTAIRRLDKALSGAGKSIADARPDDFNAAAATCRSDYSPENSYRVGQQLEAIAGFLDDHGLVARPLVWTCHIRRPTHFDRIGVERERKRGRKLPSERAIAALGEAYRRARRPIDVLAASAYALLLVTHSRISELHRLDAYDCEVEVIENGKERYGLRWYPSKGGEPETRWIPTAFVSLARDALERIRDVTDPARELARRYMADEPILPQDDPNDPFAHAGYISMKTLGTITNPRDVIATLRRNGFDLPWELAKSLGVPLSRNARLYLRAPIEQGFREELPEGFPLADPKSGLGYDRALLVCTADVIRQSSPRLLAPFLYPIRRDRAHHERNRPHKRSQSWIVRASRAGGRRWRDRPHHASPAAPLHDHARERGQPVAARHREMGRPQGCPAQRILRPRNRRFPCLEGARPRRGHVRQVDSGNPSAAGDREATDRGQSRRCASDALRRLPARLRDVALPDVPRLPELRRTCLRKRGRAS